MYLFLTVIAALMLGGIVGLKIKEKSDEKIIKQCEKSYYKYREYYNVLNKWLENIIDGYDIQEYFKENEIRTIAVYGMGELGNRLIETLSTTDITVKYGIDKNAAASSELEVRAFDEYQVFDDVDCIVVSAINLYDRIEKDLRKKYDGKVISLVDVICGV